MPPARPPRLLALAALAAALLAPRDAGALKSPIVVFLNSNQRIKEGFPQLALFGFYYGREGVNVLGVYAGPRYTFGPIGVELKGGAYGGGAHDARAIINNQIDLTTRYFSVASFTDWYPKNVYYSYLSAFFTPLPLYLGFIGDLSYDCSASPCTTLSGGPSVGVGTKAMYVATSLLFTNTDNRYLRLTVGLTF